MKDTVWKIIAGVTVAAICFPASVSFAASPGVFPDRVLLGQSAAFDGPAQAQALGLGLGMREGLLAAELGSAGRGVVVTQVVPFYEDTSLPLVKDYQAALVKADPDAETGFVSLEGYLVGRLMVTSLEKMEPDVTREDLLDIFQKRNLVLDMGGVTLKYGPGDNQGMDSVYLSALQKDGSYQYVDRLSKSIATAELP